MRLEQMYQEVILDHYKHPHGRGLRDPHQQVLVLTADRIGLERAVGRAAGEHSFDKFHQG